MDQSRIKEHAKVVGADGVDVGTVDRVEGDHIKLTRAGDPDGHHRFVPLSLVADADGQTVRLSTEARLALEFSEEQADKPSA